MIKDMMQTSSLFIASFGKTSEIDENSKKKIEKTFQSLFEEQFELVSKTKDKEVQELIYELKTPIMRSLLPDFFEKVEILLYELVEFKPHFTKFRSVNKTL